MPHNIAQIADGIDDQIAGVLTQIQEAEAEIVRLQALIPTLQADLTVLNGMKANLADLSTNDININVNINGSGVSTQSIPVQYTPNI